MALQAFNLRSPIERPTSSLPIVSRNQASGRVSSHCLRQLASLGLSEIPDNSADTLLGLETLKMCDLIEDEVLPNGKHGYSLSDAA